MSVNARAGMQRLRAIPGLGRDVTVIVLMIAAGLLAAGIILIHQRIVWPWESRYTFAADFHNATAVSPGNGQEVRIAGVPVGEITGDKVTASGEAQLTMKIKNGYPVYKDAELVLRPKSPLNEMYVELSPGSAAAGKLAAGQVLPDTQTAEPVEEDQVLDHLDTSTRQALQSLLTQADTALANAQSQLPAGLRGLDSSVNDLQPVAQALDTRRQSIATLVTDLSQISQAVGHNDTRVATLAKDLNGTLQAITSHDTQLDASLKTLPGVVDDLKTATGKVTTLADQLTPTLNDVVKASSALPTSLSKLTTTVDSLRSFATTADPVVNNARPLLVDLRPLSADLNTSTQAILPLGGRLNQITGDTLPYLNDLQNFVYNTASVASLNDANGGIFRGELLFGPQEVALGATPPAGSLAADFAGTAAKTDAKTTGKTATGPAAAKTSSTSTKESGK